jgi:hypothetical protein
MFFAENLVNIAVFAFFQPGGTLGWRAGGTLAGELPHQPFKKLLSKNPLRIL